MMRTRINNLFIAAFVAAIAFSLIFPMSARSNESWNQDGAEWDYSTPPSKSERRAPPSSSSLTPEDVAYLKYVAEGLNLPSSRNLDMKIDKGTAGSLKDLLAEKISYHLVNAGIPSRDQVHRINGNDTAKVTVGNQRDGSTPVIRIDPKVATHLKVATLPNPLPKPAVDQVTILPPWAMTRGKLSSAPVPQPVPQPAVGQARVQKASHSVATLPNPLPRPINPTALGRR